MSTTKRKPQTLREIVSELSPTTLAAISVELTATKNLNTTRFLDLVNRALVCNVGEVEAEQLRSWVRENI